MPVDAALREEVSLVAVSAAVMHQPQGWDLTLPPSIEKFLRRVPDPMISVPLFVFCAKVADAHNMGSAQEWKPQVMRFLCDRRSLDSQYTLMYLLAKYSVGLIVLRPKSVERLCDMYVKGKLPPPHPRVQMHDDADREKLEELSKMYLYLRTEYGQSNVEVE